MTRTPLTYYGGKQLLAGRIVAMMPPHRVYLEPFAGGAAVLFAKPRSDRETLNDLDGRVVRFWRALRDCPDELAAAVMATPYSRSEWEWCRDHPDCDDDVEAARRFLVHVDQSFSRSGTGWSPPSILFDRRGRWQAGVWENLPVKLAAAAGRLSGVALERSDAVDLIGKYDQPDAVIYCDPPYAAGTRREPGKGYPHDDDGELWPRLVVALQRVKRAAVLLSGYPCEHTERLGWPSVGMRHRRMVQTRAGGPLGFAPERVWLSTNLEAPLSLLTEASA